MNKLAPLLFLMVCSAGCAHSFPPNNAPFASLRSVRELDGTYANQGESRDKAPSLWASLAPTRSQDVNVEAVEIRSSDSGDLRLRAFRKGVATDEAVLAAGRDFTFEGGRVVPRVGESPRGGGGAPPLAAGAVRESLVVGLDTNGDLKVFHSARFIGSVNLLPMALWKEDEVRYRRLPGTRAQP
jgi:hypothetical protein